MQCLLINYSNHHIYYICRSSFCFARISTSYIFHDNSCSYRNNCCYNNCHYKSYSLIDMGMGLQPGKLGSMVQQLGKQICMVLLFDKDKGCYMGRLQKMLEHRLLKLIMCLTLLMFFSC